jgi:hypothetical protein
MKTYVQPVVIIIQLIATVHSSLVCDRHTRHFHNKSHSLDHLTILVPTTKEMQVFMYGKKYLNDGSQHSLRAK